MVDRWGRAYSPVALVTVVLLRTWVSRSDRERAIGLVGVGPGDVDRPPVEEVFGTDFLPIKMGIDLPWLDRNDRLEIRFHNRLYFSTGCQGRNQKE